MNNPAGKKPDMLTAEQMLTQILSVSGNFWSATQAQLAGLARYSTDFLTPLLISTRYFSEVESTRAFSRPFPETFVSYLQLLMFNLNVAARGLGGVLEAAAASGNATSGTEMLCNLLETHSWRAAEQILKRQVALFETLAYRYPKAIEAIGSEFGFHFERRGSVKVAESKRFTVYQVLPNQPGVSVHKNGKPVLILPPYVLGANILAFLPAENRSYVHCFANQGIPTYIRVLKDIRTTEALQVMTGDDDARDTRMFCEHLSRRHGRPVTLNGYCQGGFNALCDLLSGELDELVDAFITCVSPMDGTRSRGLAHFLHTLPARFNDLAYGTKTLPNGNRVADGKLMGWVYKLKSIETESPAATFLRDLNMFARQKTDDIQIGKTAAALNYWLNFERYDLPLGITEMSFASYNTPISADGTLPVKLFGRTLNLKRLAARKIPWLICYGEQDDLVERETALAPTDFIDVEVSAFPKGHVAMATSWSAPQSACALHTCFGNPVCRGPVRFHLDLENDKRKSAKQ